MVTQLNVSTSASQTYDVVVVGGGIAGLTVAYRLCNKNVLLLEKEPVAGGRTLSMNMGPYVFNQGAQMIPGGETNVAKLADELGVALSLINKTKTSTYINDKFVVASSEFKYLLALPISMVEKIKMGLKFCVCDLATAMLWTSRLARTIRNSKSWLKKLSLTC